MDDPHLAACLSQSAPRLVFVDSMSDLFHDDVPPEFIAQVFEVIRETPQHTYHVLTKRAQRLSRIAGELDWPPNLPMGVSVETRRRSPRKFPSGTA